MKLIELLKKLEKYKTKYGYRDVHIDIDLPGFDDFDCIVTDVVIDEYDSEDSGYEYMDTVHIVAQYDEPTECDYNLERNDKNGE